MEGTVTVTFRVAAAVKARFTAVQTPESVNAGDQGAGGQKDSAAHATACAPSGCPSRSSGSAPFRSCRTRSLAALVVLGQPEVLALAVESEPAPDLVPRHLEPHGFA
jgi:hypothetical protein